MSSERKSKCKFTGCSNPPVKDRLFCAEHSSQYGVGQVAAHRKHPATIQTKKGHAPMPRKRK
jgi:hypothetical protein